MKISYQIKSKALGQCYCKHGKGGVSIKPHDLIRKFAPLSRRTMIDMAIKFESIQWNAEITN